MKKITADLLPISAMSQEDIDNFMEWVWQLKPLNMFQPEIIGYPRTVMCRAQSDKPLVYIPLQTVLMYDAIAAVPGLSARQEAMCLWKIGEVVEQAATTTGVKEIYFFCRDDRVADGCARHGWEEIENVRVLRKKV